MTLLRNAVRCHACGTVAESRSVHHMNRCQCGRVSVEGGHEYALRVCRADATWDEFTVEDDDAHVEAWLEHEWSRFLLQRGRA